jgi:Predicted membrane protein (DUF2335)
MFAAPRAVASGASSPPPEPGGELEPEVVDGQVVHPQARSPDHSSRRLEVGWQQSRYASPLPSPEDLERYQKLLPDAPERLLASGEREQAHRRFFTLYARSPATNTHDPCVSWTATAGLSG